MGNLGYCIFITVQDICSCNSKQIDIAIDFRERGDIQSNPDHLFYKPLTWKTKQEVNLGEILET
jgi:hypothetical protein